MTAKITEVYEECIIIETDCKEVSREIYDVLTSSDFEEYVFPNKGYGKFMCNENKFAIMYSEIATSYIVSKIREFNENNESKIIIQYNREM